MHLACRQVIRGRNGWHELRKVVAQTHSSSFNFTWEVEALKELEQKQSQSQSQNQNQNPDFRQLQRRLKVVAVFSAIPISSQLFVIAEGGIKVFSALLSLSTFSLFRNVSCTFPESRSSDILQLTCGCNSTQQLQRRLTISVFERSVDLDKRVLRQPRFGGIGVCKRENQRVPKNTHTVENRFFYSFF